MAQQIALEPTRPMEPAPRRTFGLADAMILIAGGRVNVDGSPPSSP